MLTRDGAPAEPACCDLGSFSVAPPRAPAPFAYTDVFGFTYRLCAVHYRALLTGLRKAEGFRPKDAPATPRRATQRRPWRPLPPRRRRRAGDARASGEELRAARARVGWSLRRTAFELDRSRSQLSAAELGYSPVDPEVAAWVLRVLSPEGGPEGYPGREEEDGALARS